MTYNYYILYDQKRDVELELRYHERWGWDWRGSEEKGFSKIPKQSPPFVEANIEKFGYERPRTIWTAEQYAAALGRIAELMDAKPGTIEFHELNKWADVVADYEDRTFQIPEPTPDDLAEFREDQGGSQDNET